MPPPRTIIIGDVHGCLDELRDLLREVRASPGDRLISVGDLICKGPDSRGVLDWAMGAPNLECVIGNHELRFLRNWRQGRPQDEKPYDPETFRQLEDGFDAYMRFIERWPRHIVTPDYVVVHGGFDPRRGSPEGQPVEELANLRRLPDTGRPWYEEYRDPRLVVFGHWARREPVLRDNCVGLDTGCVYGGSLTALVLPERRLLRVPARKAYKVKESWN